MHNQVNWRFPSNDGGGLDGFNEGGLDHFKGHRLSSVVREVIQNSLDVGNNADPVKMGFDVVDISLEECGDQFLLLKPHLMACRDMAKEQKLVSAVKFYDNALKKLEEKSVRFLAVHDANTSGLTGPTDRPYGKWSALVKGSGITQKDDPGSLGSFGHGSQAPLTLSDIRSVFYLSYIKKPDGSIEKRFQGKSMLQTHVDPNAEGLTQGTGFYGWTKNCAPLLDDQIPDWATKIRDRKFGGVGTTILIPLYQLGRSEEPETAITVIANFYYAILKNNLSIDIGEDISLTKDNIKKQFEHFAKRLDEEQDYIDADRIKDNFQALTALIHSTEDGVQEVKELGTYSWFIKIDENLNATRVSIARGNGMLIKTNPKHLARFPSRKPFEMFVCVDGRGGSELLKALENPQHDDFALDRVDDAKERQINDKKYRRLTKSIRNVIDRFTKMDTTAEIDDDTLDFLNVMENDDTGDGTERSRVIEISSSAYKFRPKKPKDNLFGNGAPAPVPGQGHRGGDGKKVSEGGQIPSKTGKGIVTGGASQSTRTSTRQVLNNLRAVALPGTENKMKLVFDHPNISPIKFSLVKRGEEGSDEVFLKDSSGTIHKILAVTLTDAHRQAVVIESDSDISQFALEAYMEIENQGGN